MKTETEYKHTPGPWKAELTSDQAMCPITYYEITGDSMAWVAQVAAGSLRTEDTARANAELIAQAPALLLERDALKVQLREQKGLYDNEKTISAKLEEANKELIEALEKIESSSFITEAQEIALSALTKLHS
jgi:hypothetical protein